MIAKLVKTLPRIADFKPFASAGKRPDWGQLPADLQAEAIRQAESYRGFRYPLLPAAVYMNFHKNGNATIYDQLYFTRRRALARLALGECVAGKGEYLSDIINGIWAICEESGWHVPSHNYNEKGGFHILPDTRQKVLDLFACDTAGLLAAVLYLLEDQLNQETPQLALRIQDEIRQRILQPYLHGYVHWMAFKGEKINNWTPWCTKNVLLAALLKSNLSEAEKRQVIGLAARSLDAFLDSYEPDGCCDEGPAYYRASGLNFYHCLEILNGVSDNHFTAVFQTDKVKNLAAYILNMQIKDDCYANFADCAPVIDPPPLEEFRFAKAVENPAMMNYAAREHGKHTDLTRSQSISLYEKVWGLFGEQELRDYQPGPVIKHNIYYPGVGIFIARDQDYFLAVKGGGNGDSHNHNDTGSVIFYHGREPLLIDVGPATYFAQTFSEKRYELWYNQSAYHNVMTFGEVMQSAGQEYRARLEDYSLQAERAFIRLDLTGCYPPGTVVNYARSVELIQHDKLRINDYAEGCPAGSFLSLMTKHKPQPDGEGYQLAGHQMSIRGSGKIEIETILLDDVKLINNWGECLYRTRIYPASGQETSELTVEISLNIEKGKR